MYNYHFDDAELLLTAKVVFKINPAAAEFGSPEALVGQMKADVRVNLDKPSYLSIYGYVLTTFNYPGRSGTLGVKASLSSYTVAKHLGVSDVS